MSNIARAEELNNNTACRDEQCERKMREMAVRQGSRIQDAGLITNGCGGHEEDDSNRLLNLSPDEEILVFNAKDPDRSPITVDGYADGLEIPMVLHGNILIQNCIDAIGGPRHVDVITGNDSDGGGFVVEDNVNLFHCEYFQSRENPVYKSDPELAETTDDKMASLPADHLVNRMSISDTDQSSNFSHLKYGALRKKVRKKLDNGKLCGLTSSPGSDMTRDEISRLLQDAPADSIKQTMHIEREEEEITKEDAGVQTADDEGDRVSEKLDVALEDGVVVVTMKIFSEHIQTKAGSSNKFKKLKTIVTRVITVDLTTTEERRQLYNKIFNGPLLPFLPQLSSFKDFGEQKILPPSSELKADDNFAKVRPEVDVSVSEREVTKISEHRVSRDGHGRTSCDELSRKPDDEQRDEANRVAPKCMPRTAQTNKSSNVESQQLGTPGDEDEFEFDSIPELDMNYLENKLEERFRPRQPLPRLRRTKGENNQPTFALDGAGILY